MFFAGFNSWEVWSTMNEDENVIEELYFLKKFREGMQRGMQNFFAWIRFVLFIS